MKNRVRILQLIFVFWSLLLITRLFYWQVYKSPELRREALAQYGTQQTLMAPRGLIYFSDGFPMVANQESYMLYSDPKLLPKRSEELERLFGLLPASVSARTLLAQPGNNRLSWLALSHRISPALRKDIEYLKIPGLGFETESHRVYSEGTSSAYLTGFVGQDSLGNPKGYFGLEGYYDRQLSGKPGKIWDDRDVLNRQIVISSSNRIAPQPGSNLYTSIDRTVMYIAYRQLVQGMQKYQSLAGSVAIMETATGRVLAMINVPGYSPADYSNTDHQLYRNPLVAESYEPGSTFKTIVMSAALDAGVVTPNTKCTICGGPVEYSGKKVSSWDNKYYPNSTMTDIILHSDNVGMTFVSRSLGKEKLAGYLAKFGFGRPTGIDLQEDTSPYIRPASQWQDIDWATVSFGQGIAVTPLQLLVAVNALANHGQLIPPRIVNRISYGDTVREVSSGSPVRVISPKAAAQITQMMVNGVNQGPVHVYKPDGYLIAGKTGTAQVPIAGYYDPDKVISSFIGFAPADSPKFTMLVILRQPNSTDWGSSTAAPIWFNIAKELFRYYQIAPHS